MKALLLAFLLPTIAVANLPIIRIIASESVEHSPQAVRFEPLIELANAGETPLAYRVCGDADRPIWAGGISFELLDEAGNTAAPLYFHPSDIFSAREVILGIGMTVQLRYRQPVRARLAPGRYTLKGTAVVEDEHGKRHKIQCIPATFVVAAESSAPLPDTPTRIGNH